MAKSGKQVKWTFIHPYQVGLVELSLSYEGESVVGIGIEDQPSLKRFLEKAKALWLEYNHNKVHGRGRPSQRGKVIQTLWSEMAKGRIGRKATQGKLIRLVHERLESRGSKAPSNDAIRKYVKMWRILQKRNLIIPRVDLPSADLRWFNKNAPKTMRMLRAYAEEISTLNLAGFHCSLNSFDTPYSMEQ